MSKTKLISYIFICKKMLHKLTCCLDPHKHVKYDRIRKNNVEKGIH